MAFDLKKVLKAWLLSSSQPLSLKDIQAAFARFHEQADAWAATAVSEEGGEEGAAAAPPPLSVEVGVTAEGTERPSEPPVEEPVLIQEAPEDAALYRDVPSLITAAQIREAMDEIARELKMNDDGLLLIEGANGYRLATHPRFGRWIRILRQEPPPVKLSQSSLETLAVVAYRQPVTRAEIETIRGVAAEAGVTKLLERELIAIVGRADLPGRPLQYGTTEKFLEFVGVKSLDELPASDVLSSRQIDEWLRNSANPSKPTDKDMGLEEEPGPDPSTRRSISGSARGPGVAGKSDSTPSPEGTDESDAMPSPEAIGGIDAAAAEADASGAAASAPTAMDLAPIRDKIDAIDRQLVEMINRRLALAVEIGKIKRSTGGEIYVPEREEAVLRKIGAQNQGPIKNEALRAIYREIMSAAIALEKPLLVAYLGPEASNTHAAAMKKFGASVDYHAMAAIADIFTAVEKGEADLAVIPIENSTEGSVRETLDSFVESDLKIVGQIYLEITHALISRSGLEQIVRVYSKDQALAQCRHWLQRHLPHAQLVDAPSTSRAVQIARDDPAAGAVAGELAADFYGVPVVARNIQDKADNTTRFFVLGRKAAGPVGHGKDVTSFLISLGDEAAAHSGALLKMLMPLAERGINLSKIESRPSKKRPWDYYFFIDVSGHHDDDNMKAALTELKRVCPMVKWLGSYPAAS